MRPRLPPPRWRRPGPMRRRTDENALPVHEAIEGRAKAFRNGGTISQTHKDQETSGGPGTRLEFPRPLGSQAARKPDSVLDDHSSRRRVAAPLQQPTRKFRLSGRGQTKLSAWAHRADTLVPAGECGRDPCLFGLAPCGVYHAATITGRPVRSYRTISPLPPAACSAWLAPVRPFGGGIFSVALAVYAP